MSIVVTNEGYQIRRVADDYILFGQNQKCAYVFNETGAFLWKGIMEEKTKEELVEALIEKYSIDKILAADDVNKFIDKCVSEGFLSEVG